MNAVSVIDARTTTDLPAAEGRMRAWAEAGAAFVRILHEPLLHMPVVMFPLIAYVLFALMLGPPAPVGGVAWNMLATYTPLGMIAPGLFGLGVGVALGGSRVLGKRSASQQAGVLLAVRLTLAIILAALASLSLMVLAATAGEIVLEALQWLSRLGWT